MTFFKDFKKRNYFIKKIKILISNTYFHKILPFKGLKEYSRGTR